MKLPTRTVDLDGPVVLMDMPGPDAGPVFVLVHGLGGSLVNWMSLAPLLATRGRVIAPDLAGFGRTPLAGRSASLDANRSLLHRVIESEIGGPVVLVGNSMGGLISLLETDRAPELVSGLVLVDPAVPRAAGAIVDGLVAASFAAYMVPGIGERFINRRLAVLGPDRVAQQTLQLCTVDAARVDPALVEAQLELARERAGTMPWATAAFLQAARSLVRTLARRGRFMEMIRRVSAPTLLLMGRQDRLVQEVAAAAIARTRPDWDYVVFENCGHVPMMEYPKETFAAVERWLDGPAARAINAAAGRRR